jgi:AraC family transcriptional regulator of adaptative response / DNA-3-methyladenine glycosylase II
VVGVLWSDDGRGEVNVVRTTGIYCRAGCAGRPLATNCTQLRSPAEAEAAGYRACLRCRSDRLPLVSTAPGSDPIVARALVLIGDGFLDRHDEAALGREVGASARHLRRMFNDVVGATPSQIAASRRAHFARSLLDDTDLTVTEIAFAAGFGSVRRMNEVVRAVFRASPSELRGRRGRPDRSAVDGGLRVTLHAHRPIDVGSWQAMVADTLIPGVESFDGEVFRRSTHACGHAGIIELDVVGPHRADVTLHLPSTVAAIDEVGRCRRLLGLDRTDGAPSRAWTPFEGAVRDAFTDRREELIAVVRLLGAPIAGTGGVGVDREFPTPHEVLDATDRLLDVVSDGAAAALHGLAAEHLDRLQ